MACPHENWETRVIVNRLTNGDDGPVTGYTSDITARCVECRVPMVWVGLAMGSSPYQPTVSVDETELRAPGRPGDWPT